MYNQYLLVEIIKQQAKAEQAVDEKMKIKEILDKQGININDLLVLNESSHDSLEKVFHPATTYNKIERINRGSLYYSSPKFSWRKARMEFINLTLDLFHLSVDAQKDNLPFYVDFTTIDIFFPLDHDSVRASLAKLEQLETYLFQRHAEQQPRPIHTYRTNTESIGTKI